MIRRVVKSKLPSVASKSYYMLDEIDSLDDFVEGLAIPHLSSIIISEDYECEPSNGYDLYWLSEPYGAMEFPITLQCPALELMVEGSEALRIGDDKETAGGADSPSSSGRGRWKRRLRSVYRIMNLDLRVY